MNEHLYIIGNGFDRHHDIPSKYQDYREWLEKNECWDLIEIIDDLFGYTDDDWWSRFEDNLGSAETLKIAVEEAFEHYPDFGSDQFRDRDWYEAELSVERRMGKAYDAIICSFSDWVMQLPKGNLNKKIRMEHDSLFLTFNYSYTLENLYGISSDRILHIHGRAGTDEGLILGHGLTYNELENRMGERADDGDYVLQHAKDAAIYSVSLHKKPVEKIITKHQSWFSGLRDITHIHIYGFSFSKVDLPYLNKIFASVNKKNIQIDVSAFSEDDKKTIKSYMNSEGIPFSDEQLVKLDNLLIL